MEKQKKRVFNLWESTEEESVEIEYYSPAQKNCDAAVIIFPGGGYRGRAEYEGKDYAEMISKWGIASFVVQYRVFPERFPKPLMDARRAIQFVRSKAIEFGIDKNKIAVMGSSAGGHLAALVSTFTKIVDMPCDKIGAESYLPNAQILCYPVISSDERISHKGSYQNLLGEGYQDRAKYSPELLVDAKTPSAFIWHTADDASVSVLNSYRYAEALKNNGVSCEMHIFPNGRHGLGLAIDNPQVSKWAELLQTWIIHTLK